MSDMEYYKAVAEFCAWLKKNGLQAVYKKSGKLIVQKRTPKFSRLTGEPQ